MGGQGGRRGDNTSCANIGGCQLPPLAMDTAFTTAAIATGRDGRESRLQRAAGMELSLLWSGCNLHGHLRMFTHTHTHTVTLTCTHNDKLAPHTHTIPYVLAKSNQISYLDCQAVLEKTFSSHKIDGHFMLAAINCCIIRLTSYLLEQFGEYKSLGIYKNHLITSCVNFKDVLLQALFG